MTIVNELLATYNVLINHWNDVKEQYQDVKNQNRSQLIPEINKLIDPVLGCMSNFPDPTDDCKELISQSFNEPDQLPEKIKAVLDGNVINLELDDVETKAFPVIIGRYMLANHRIPTITTLLHNWDSFSARYKKWVLKA